jgi:hypothetical protein
VSVGKRMDDQNGNALRGKARHSLPGGDGCAISSTRRRGFVVPRNPAGAGSALICDCQETTMDVVLTTDDVATVIIRGLRR